MNVPGVRGETAARFRVNGWVGAWTRSAESLGRPTDNTLGFEFRQDRIDPVGVYATRRRGRLSTTIEDSVVEGSLGLYAQNDTRWADWFRSIAGLRYDTYRFNVTAGYPANSGNVTAGIWSPKLSLVFGPWSKTEYFVNAGSGVHSNDARGETIKSDPEIGEPVDPATPLVRSKGAELGLRTEAVPNLQSSLALWYLKLDSELVFVGDGGNIEAGRPSQRYGVEWSSRWRPQPWLLVDFDLAWNHARLLGTVPEGNYVPRGAGRGGLGRSRGRTLRALVGRAVPALHRLLPDDRGQPPLRRATDTVRCASGL
ncbi:MAG: TonB-dependent receptor [Rubrivivax sp.]|nr:TonB-dependent receptor [Rubrivivax sp.]